MKTQKLTLAAVLATTLLSTSAFAAIPINGNTSTTATVNLSLTIEPQCTVEGLSSQQSLNFDQSTNEARLANVYAQCNSGTPPQIQFSSSNSVSNKDFQLALGTGTEKIAYTIRLGTVDVAANTNVSLPTSTGADLVFRANYTSGSTTPTAGDYTDLVTATISL